MDKDLWKLQNIASAARLPNFKQAVEAFGIVMQDPTPEKLAWGKHVAIRAMIAADKKVKK